ncbi:polysaccharide deacetylase family protein [Streptococcus hyovaginalis]|uniref:polysaccharide deacetylase family protein n=1 Tax=Streptococcus hyovaginalis TaxID=149015 RepID=UPI002A90BAD4|nr:polysaccharide deacetylase family protein [Streptococcus hyovaginalis]MDY5973334.1 polysaccharide deacetylase family protein [Streptococcus hyovaginalis]
MRKVLFSISLLGLLLSILWLFGKPLYLQSRQDKLVTFVSQAQKKIAGDETITNGREVWQRKGSWIYFNKDGEGSKIHQALEALMPAPEKNQTTNLQNIESLHLIYPQKVHCDLNAVKAVRLQEDAYSVSWMRIGDPKVIYHDHLYFKDDAYKEPFTLNDLIRDKSTFRDTLKKTVESTDQAEQTAFLKRFEANDWSDIPFYYEKSTLHLSSHVKLPLKAFVGAVQGRYLKENDLKVYQNYLNQNKENLKRVALTFDDGPSPVTTPKVLDILAKYHAKATFFSIGSKVEDQAQLVKRMVADGHEIGNHTWSHPNLTHLSEAAVRQELTLTNEAIKKVTGSLPHLMRPPFGSTNATVKAVSEMTEVLWTVDTLDWQSRSSTAILDHVKAQLKPGGIILMHDIHQSSVDALPAVLDYLQSQGYEVVTVSELNGYSGV